MAKTKIPANPILSARIKETRLWIKDGSKMTQMELAEKIAVDEQTIRKYEKGKSGVPKVAVVAIAKVFGCCTEYLYGETNCFTVDEYQQEQQELKSIISRAVDIQNKANKQWEITKSFFKEFLGCQILNTSIMKKDGSFVPIILIEDDCGSRYTFSSRHEAEAFLLSFCEDAAKLLRYRLLDYADTKNRDKTETEMKKQAKSNDDKL